jgi:N-carbamoyl-L-amino-acid hydrolase
LSLDIRAADDGTRDAALADILLGIQAICARRRVDLKLEQVLQAQAAPCAPWLMRQLGEAAVRAGIELLTLPSGAGHDAMAMRRLTDVAMLFVRCGNGGISHNPLETVTADDLDLSARIFADFLRNFSTEPLVNSTLG